MDRTPYYENSFVFSKIKTKRHTFNNAQGITENKMLPDSLRPVEQYLGSSLCANVLEIGSLEKKEREKN